jgi:hypothetical protein
MEKNRLSRFDWAKIVALGGALLSIIVMIISGLIGWSGFLGPIVAINAISALVVLGLCSEN